MVGSSIVFNALTLLKIPRGGNECTCLSSIYEEVVILTLQPQWLVKIDFTVYPL